MVYLGYILPPKNQKIYEDDIKIAVQNEKRDKKISKKNYDERFFLDNYGFLESKTEYKSVSSTNKDQPVRGQNKHTEGDSMTVSQLNEMLKKQIQKKTTNDLVDFDPILTKPTKRNTDLDDLKPPINFIGELKNKLKANNRGLKSPVFNSNLVKDEIPVNDLIQELRLKFKQPNMSLKSKLEDAKQTVDELREIDDMMLEDVKIIVEEVVKENKNEIFSSFNKSLIDSPNLKTFEEEHTIASSTIGDFDELYLKWNKDINLFNQILKDLMKTKNFSEIKIFNSKSKGNQKPTQIYFNEDGYAYKLNKKKEQILLNEKQLYYTLLNAIKPEGLIGKGVSNYHPKNFGNLYLSMIALRKNDLRLYNPHSNTVILVHKNMTPLLHKMIKSIKKDMKFENDDYANLSKKEQMVMDKVVNFLRIDNDISGGLLQDENFNLKNRYEILISSINAGNGGKLVFQELKKVLKQLKNNRAISPAKYKIIMDELN